MSACVPTMPQGPGGGGGMSTEGPVERPDSGGSETGGTAAAPSRAELEGTTWYRMNSEIEGGTVQACLTQGAVRLLPDGFFDYQSRCSHETEYRSYEGITQNATWTVGAGRTLVLFFNDGYNVCTMDWQGGGFSGVCRNINGAENGITMTRQD